MERTNPFALVRASDYTDAQINSLWVEIGQSVINSIIEPRSIISKYILGGKGTGKTHLLRYYSYSVSRLRSQNVSGLAFLEKQKYLAIFLRATSVDAERFQMSSQDTNKWQHLFAVYLELRLAEGVLDALCDIKGTSVGILFDDQAFITEIGKFILDESVLQCSSIEDFREWLIRERRKIDVAVNDVAFTGLLNLKVPFSISKLCLPIRHAMGKWHSSLSDLPLIYLIDEIENLSEEQQQVVNTLIRYGEGLATFRVTGRLYARKTLFTIANGEENREGAEFKTEKLDDILRKYPKYLNFAEKFVFTRIGLTGKSSKELHRGPSSFFEEIDSSHYYSGAISTLGLDKDEPDFIKKFNLLLSNQSASSAEDTKVIVTTLTDGIPLLLQKLNFLIYCKKSKKAAINYALANKIRADSLEFSKGKPGGKGSYANAYASWAADLFAQLCRESKKSLGVPYAGFEDMVRMSSGNPRNLLVILGRAYEIAAFKGIDFINGPKLSISMQTEAAVEAARFMYERDTNYGSEADLARDAVTRLASILRVARFSLNIPEVSPLAVSFDEADLSEDGRKALHSALKYSFVYQISEGRPDRNSQRINTKIQLNPLLSPRWGLPIARRGDIGLSRDMVNAIFDPTKKADFDILLKGLDNKWNNPFGRTSPALYQEGLF
jgi:hypothetical protein